MMNKKKICKIYLQSIFKILSLILITKNKFNRLVPVMHSPKSYFNLNR